jgi:hypothetical protein
MDKIIRHFHSRLLKGMINIAARADGYHSYLPFLLLVWIYK